MLYMFRVNCVQTQIIISAFKKTDLIVLFSQKHLEGDFKVKIISKFLFLPFSGTILKQGVMINMERKIAAWGMLILWRKLLLRIRIKPRTLIIIKLKKPCVIFQSSLQTFLSEATCLADMHNII